MKELHLSAMVKRQGARATHCIESFWILAVDSRKRVSFGGILWKTTLEIEDFPLLLIVSGVMISWADCSPSLTHQQQSRLALRGRTWSWLWSFGRVFPVDIESVLFIDTFKI
jgi:hypothetical protein